MGFAKKKKRKAKDRIRVKVNGEDGEVWLYLGLRWGMVNVWG